MIHVIVGADLLTDDRYVNQKHTHIVPEVLVKKFNDTNWSNFFFFFGGGSGGVFGSVCGLREPTQNILFIFHT